MRYWLRLQDSDKLLMNNKLEKHILNSIFFYISSKEHGMSHLEQKLHSLTERNLTLSK